MKYQIKVTQEILDENRPYADNYGCSIYRALEIAGVKVRSVGGASFSSRGYDVALPDIAVLDVSEGGMRTVISKEAPTGFAGPFQFEVEIPSGD